MELAVDGRAVELQELAADDDKFNGWSAWAIRPASARPCTELRIVLEGGSDDPWGLSAALRLRCKWNIFLNQHFSCSCRLDSIRYPYNKPRT